MSKEPVNIARIMNEDKFKEYGSMGLIDEIAVRNLKIKWDYFNLRKTLSMIDSIFTLSEKYFLSYDSVNSILFGPYKKNLNTGV